MEYLLLIMAFTLLLVGCSGSGDDNDEAEPPLLKEGAVWENFNWDREKRQ